MDAAIIIVKIIKKDKSGRSGRKGKQRQAIGIIIKKE